MILRKNNHQLRNHMIVIPFHPLKMYCTNTIYSRKKFIYYNKYKM